MTRKKSILAMLALLGMAVPVMLAGFAQQQEAQQAQEPADKPQKPIRIDVDLVLVTATVTDPQNRFVTGLEQENFQVFEDRVEQKIEYFSSEDVALTVGIVFDVSGSMKDKLSTARDAAVTFLKTGNPDDEYFLVSFASRPEVVEDFTTDISRLQNHLIFTPAKGMTALYDSVYVGLEKLKDGTNSKKALLLITDGEDNRSRYTFSNVKEFVKEQDVQIYSIGIVNDWNSQLGSGRTGRALVEELSELTGGRAYFPDSVYELEDICTKIAIELKNQYVLGYRSTNEAKNGKWRNLRVRVNPPKGLPHLNVRAKSGYYGPTGDGTSGQK
ncbi:MAG: VWA domain-containing protein [Acidobacteria bacterium]|nr:VWA domain-containing protein [Acidobacteriota bacterium]